MASRFLLVSLGIDAILAEVTISARRQKLDEIIKGNNLGDACTTTIARMKPQKGSRSRLGMEALMWISNSERPLKTSELCHALRVNVPTIRTLLGCSLGLIMIEASSSTVQLIHFTLQEYLSNNPSLFQSPHSMIAEVYLTYLSFRDVRELSPTLYSLPSMFPLLGYISCYWGKHIRRDRTEDVILLALGVLVRFEEHISSRLFLAHHWGYTSGYGWGLSFDSRSSPMGFPGLHRAAVLGIGEIVAALLTMKEWDINERDPVGRTALAWAAVGGHEEVVRILLQRKDIPNMIEHHFGALRRKSMRE